MRLIATISGVIALLILLNVGWEYVIDYVAVPAYDGTDLGSLGDPNRPLYSKWRHERRELVNMTATHPTPVLKDPMASGGTQPGDFYSNNERQAKLAHGFEVTERKLHAEVNGTIIPDKPAPTLKAQGTDWWQPLHVQIFEGDLVCVTGDVYAPNYRGGQHFGPYGVNDTNVEGVEKYDPRFPLFAFMGRVDGDNGKVFPMYGPPNPACPNSGPGFVSRYTGWLDGWYNVPYWAYGHNALPGYSNFVLGNFSIVQVERGSKSQAAPKTIPVQAPATSKSKTEEF